MRQRTALITCVGPYVGPVITAKSEALGTRVITGDFPLLTEQ
ncbi:MAG: hypothetical protein OSB34_12095 [Planktomarina sp.]|nr:hypothetical protein [Planktomarina sp.]